MSIFNALLIFYRKAINFYRFMFNNYWCPLIALKLNKKWDENKNIFKKNMKIEWIDQAFAKDFSSLAAFQILWMENCKWHEAIHTNYLLMLVSTVIRQCTENELNKNGKCLNKRSRLIMSKMQECLLFEACACFVP